MSANEVRWIYGYGATKHIENLEAKDNRQTDLPYALCGAVGGYPRDEPERPVCKRCAAKSARILGVPDDEEDVEP
jgi:hypothetical protein